MRNIDASQQVSSAIKAGFRHIDCAQMYKNEESVGKGIAESGVPRSELYITTKLLPVPDEKTAVDTLRESLAKMRLDYVDLLLIHEPVGHRSLKDMWRETEECKKLGLAKSTGVSNFRIQDLEEIKGPNVSAPVINQVGG